MFHKSDLPYRVYKTKINSRRIYYFIYFFIGVLSFIFLVFIFLFLPSAKIILSVAPEPLIVNFEIKLDTQIKNILFNLDGIPARLADLNSQNIIQKQEKLIPDLIDQQSRQGIVFKEKDLIEIIDYKIKQLIGPDKTAVEMADENLTIQVKSLDFNLGQAAINVLIKTKAISSYNFTEIKRGVAYQEISKAEEYLNSLNGVRGVRIKSLLSLFRRMPYFPQRINIALDIF